MRIVLYGSPDAPPAIRVMAAYLEGSRLLPVVHYAKTAPEARLKAQTFWDTEQQKLIDKGLKRQERAAKKAEPSE